MPQSPAEYQMEQTWKSNSKLNANWVDRGWGCFEKSTRMTGFGAVVPGKLPSMLRLPWPPDTHLESLL